MLCDFITEAFSQCFTTCAVLPTFPLQEFSGRLHANGHHDHAMEGYRMQCFSNLSMNTYSEVHLMGWEFCGNQLRYTALI